MKGKIIIASLFILLSMPLLAEMDCVSSRNNEESSIKIKVIDTFLERTAFIQRHHPTIKYPKEDLGVHFWERSDSIGFSNQDNDFVLIVNKVYSERRLPAIHKGMLLYRDYMGPMDCVFQ